MTPPPAAFPVSSLVVVDLFRRGDVGGDGLVVLRWRGGFFVAFSSSASIACLPLAGLSFVAVFRVVSDREDFFMTTSA